MSDQSWYSKNERTIRWATMIGAWAGGVALIATGAGVLPGVALIVGGSAYGGYKPVVTALRNGAEGETGKDTGKG